MPVNKRLKNTIAAYLLARELRHKKRVASPVSLQGALTVGIVYDSTPEKTYELIKKTVKELRAMQKDVLAIGFYNKAELPAMRFSKLGLDFFTRKNLNWQLKPSGTVVSNFIRFRFDILIVLNSESCMPVRYIAAQSDASFKIGKYDPVNASICDMMIDTGEETSTARLLQHILNYLNMIKNDNPKT